MELKHAFPSPNWSQFERAACFCYKLGGMRADVYDSWRWLQTRVSTDYHSLEPVDQLVADSFLWKE